MKNSFGTSLLIIICFCLQASGPPIDHWDLYRATLYGNIKIVKRLLELGVPINCFDSKNYRPIDYAVHGDYTKIVKLLLNAGALVNKNTFRDAKCCWANQKIKDLLYQKLIEQCRPTTLLGCSIRALLLQGMPEYQVAIKLATIKDDLPLEPWHTQKYLFDFLDLP